MLRTLSVFVLFLIQRFRFRQRGYRSHLSGKQQLAMENPWKSSTYRWRCPSNPACSLGIEGDLPSPPVNTAAKGPTHADWPRGPSHKKPIWVRRGVEGKGLWSLNKNGDCSTQRLGKRQPKYSDFTSLIDVRKGFSLIWICYIREFKDSMNKNGNGHLVICRVWLEIHEESESERRLAQRTVKNATDLLNYCKTLPGTLGLTTNDQKKVILDFWNHSTRCCLPPSQYRFQHSKCSHAFENPKCYERTIISDKDVGGKDERRHTWLVDLPIKNGDFP